MQDDKSMMFFYKYKRMKKTRIIETHTSELYWAQLPTDRYEIKLHENTAQSHMHTHSHVEE